MGVDISQLRRVPLGVCVSGGRGCALASWSAEVPAGGGWKPRTHSLEPRTSFQQWVETVAGTSKEWTEDQGKVPSPDNVQQLKYI